MQQAAGRLQVLAQQQLAAAELDVNQQLFANKTSAADNNAREAALLEQGEPYAVPLPEKLYPDQSWQVYRYAVRLCNEHLVSPTLSTAITYLPCSLALGILQEHLVSAQAGVQLRGTR